MSSGVAAFPPAEHPLRDRSPMNRQILHVDMDAFFAAIEQRDFPALRGRPVLVGGGADQRGVVATASYEARPFGCRSAMPTAQALKLCPDAVLVRGRMEVYAAESRTIRAIFEHFTPEVEPLSIDEAFLDVTGSQRLFGSGVEIARRIKAAIVAETRLTASIGVAPNKFLAKLASDLDKPDGLTVVPAEGVEGFLAPLPIRRLWGAGPRVQARFAELGVATFADAWPLSVERLEAAFGEHGREFYRLLRGIDERPVEPDRDAKSISHEQTFARDVRDVDRLRLVLLEQTERVAQRLRAEGRLARTVTLKIRSGRFETLTRRSTLPQPTDRTDHFWATAKTLFEAWRRERFFPVRLIGMGVSGLRPRDGAQLDLFADETAVRQAKLDAVADEIRRRFGKEALNRMPQTRRAVNPYEADE
jgi:DNA polymerase IV